MSPIRANALLGSAASNGSPIPSDLRERDHWVTWRYEDRDGKPTKVLCQVSGERASSTDPATWTTFDLALAARDGFAGIGFVFSTDDPFFGADLDDCRDPATGELHPPAAEIVRRFGTYTEVSPSSCGVKLIGRGRKLDGWRSKTKDTPWGAYFELYDQGRFFTITGDVLPGLTAIRGCQAELEAVYAEVFPGSDSSPPPSGGSNGRADDEAIRRAIMRELGHPGRPVHDNELAIGRALVSLPEARAVAYAPAVLELVRIMRPNDAGRIPSLNEVERAIRDGRRWALAHGMKGADLNGGGRRGRLTPYAVADMAQSEAPEVPWQIRDFAAREEVTQLWARGGAMKSLMSMALGNGVAEGEDVAGMECERGIVVYFDAENGEGEFHRRVRGLELSGDRFFAFGVNGLHLVRDLAVFEDALADIEAEQGEAPALVVYDSLRRLLPGAEENDSAEMAAAVAAVQDTARRRAHAAVVVHHANKAGTAGRGSSAIEDQVSLSFKLGREPGDPDRTRRFLDCEKCRIGPEPARRWLKLDVGKRGEVYVEQAAAFEPGCDEMPPRQAALALRVREALAHGPLTRSEIAKQLDRGPKDGTVRRVLGRMTEAGELAKDDTHRYQIVGAANDD